MSEKGWANDKVRNMYPDLEIFYKNFTTSEDETIKQPISSA